MIVSTVLPVPRSIKARCYYVTEWRRPWKPDGVRRNVAVTRWPVWVRWLLGRPGVYLVRDAKTKKMLYVGRARKCLKSTLLRHFRQWSDRWRLHRLVTFDRNAVEVKVYLVRAEWVDTTEADLILMHSPRDNTRAEAASRSSRVPF